jgi:hypothetical protein
VQIHFKKGFTALSNMHHFLLAIINSPQNEGVSNILGNLRAVPQNKVSHKTVYAYPFFKLDFLANNMRRPK